MGFTLNPTVIVFSIVVGLIPSFAWLIFYLQEDIKHPEPKRMILFAFLLGCLITYGAVQAQSFFHRTTDFFSIDFDRLDIDVISPLRLFAYFLTFGGIEELFKFLAIFLFMHKLKAFDEPIHAMIYMITAALGFAAVENIASLYDASQGSLLNIAILESLALRFVGATLLHTLASGLVGYYWSQAFVRGANKFSLIHERELHPILKGLVIATVLHAIFNYLIIRTGPATLAIAFVVFIAFFLLNDFERLKRADA